MRQKVLQQLQKKKLYKMCIRDREDVFIELMEDSEKQEEEKESEETCVSEEEEE